MTYITNARLSGFETAAEELPERPDYRFIMSARTSQVLCAYADRERNLIIGHPIFSGRGIVDLDLSREVHFSCDDEVWVLDEESYFTVLERASPPGIHMLTLTPAWPKQEPSRHERNCSPKS